MSSINEPATEFLPRGSLRTCKYGMEFTKCARNMPICGTDKRSNKHFRDIWYLRQSTCHRTSNVHSINARNALKKYDHDDIFEPLSCEDELYISQNVVFRSRAEFNFTNEISSTSFTSDCRIQFAFFCKWKSLGEDCTICVIDDKTLKIWCSDSEEYITNLQFPISKAWPTSYGLLLEMVPSYSALPEIHVALPRLFSITHPLNEFCPVLKTSTSKNMEYILDENLIIIHSADDSDILVAYDGTIKKHIVLLIRKAKDVTRAVVSDLEYVHNKEQLIFSSKSSSVTSMYNSSRAELEYSQQCKVPTNCLECENHYFTENAVKNVYPVQSLSAFHNITSSSKFKSPKSIGPELCLEYLWEEDVKSTEVAARAFIHIDVLGQTFLCYLQPRLGQLNMILMARTQSSAIEMSRSSFKIPAKEAVSLPRMNLLVVLTPSNNLVIYTGTTILSSVLASPRTVSCPSNKIYSDNIVMNDSLETKNHLQLRQRSLLSSSTALLGCKNRQYIHALSPVHPLPQEICDRKLGTCDHLQNAVGNSIIAIYSNNRMFRICLPAMSESFLITRCINVLRHVLKAESFLHFIALWYRTRNIPDSGNLSRTQEWHLFKNTLLNITGWPQNLSQRNAKAKGSTKQCGANDSSSRKSNLTLNNRKMQKKRTTQIFLKNSSNWNFLKSSIETWTISSSETNRIHDEVNTNAPLFKVIPILFHCFHLLYEDLKLETLHRKDIPLLADLLSHMATGLHLSTYANLYSLDFPVLAQKPREPCTISRGQLMQMDRQDLLQIPACGVFHMIDHLLQKNSSKSYTCVENVNDLSKNVLELVSILWQDQVKPHKWEKKLTGLISYSNAGSPRNTRQFQILEKMKSSGFSRHIMCCFPVSLQIILNNYLCKARLTPPIDGSPFEYCLIMRPELAMHSSRQKTVLINPEAEDSLTPSPNLSSTTYNVIAPHNEEDDGMDHIDTKLFRLRFPDDMRVFEVRRLLSSSKPILIDLVQPFGTSDHDFIEEKEKHLLALCSRTMALSIGRGMFTLQTSRITGTGNMPIPKLCLIGKESKQGTIVEIQQIEFPANMHLWPSFHNGVAAGLLISPDSFHIDSTWIIFNRNKPDTAQEHAGFLLGLGLNGHLKALSFMSLYEYLVKCDEMTTIGLLLGISATHRGTMDKTTAKLLSVHLEALLPVTAFELDIPQNIQVAALMGIGLLYQGSAKRHIAEILINEIGRPPGPEMENSCERESYALAAGLALGMVTLGQGETAAELRDLVLPDILHYYIVGGHRYSVFMNQKQKRRQPSFKIHEGDHVNIDITAPGATLALGLMFFNTNNYAIAEWMQPPNTSYLLSLMRPDLLQLRIISRNLVMWESVKPTKTWFDGQLPDNIVHNVALDKKLQSHIHFEVVDKECAAQSYCNILAGAAFSIGLKFAGTEDKEAYSSLMSFIKQFLGLPGTPKGELSGRTTTENCLIILLISVALVCAGSGNCHVLRIIRYLRSRVGARHSHVTYGSHLATHMALGLLFIGGGRLTVSRAPEAVATLICALFPKFPIHSNDNRYHLQAFRHLYVLATERRLFLTRDIDTFQLCPSHVSVLEVGSKHFRELQISPCFLPDLCTLRKVVVHDENYWPIYFEKSRNWDQLINVLRNSECINIKKRTGCLSHVEDPCRLRSLLAQTITAEQTTCWKTNSMDIQKFASEQLVPTFLDRFIAKYLENPTSQELFIMRHLNVLFYNAVVKDTLHILSLHLTLYNDALIWPNNRPADLWHLKLTDKYLSRVLENSVGIACALELTRMVLDLSFRKTELIGKCCTSDVININETWNLEQSRYSVVNGVNRFNIQSAGLSEFECNTSPGNLIDLLFHAMC